MQKFAFWHYTVDQIYAHLKSRREGLTSAEANRRLKSYGPNSLKPPKRGKGISLLLSQFNSPLILLLIGAAILSLFLGGFTDAVIILSIVILSGLLSFFQERGAINALEKLLQLVETKVSVLRDGKEIEISIDHLVPGDVVLLRAGDLVPADCLIIDTKHFFVDEATLTGESAPVEKEIVICDPDAPIFKRTNSLFLGTTVVSGIATAIVVVTGTNTEYSQISEQIRKKTPETAFEVGVRKFGNFLLKVTLILVGIIFIVNIFLEKPIVESFLFALAIAVGLTPQLLPAIISVNLSHGARRMAAKKVVVKRLASIENFGQMNILCADKTGTLTKGKIQLEDTVSIDGQKSEKVALYGFLNSHFQAGYSNFLDQAILQGTQFDASSWKKVDEIPYDFTRKRLSVVLENQGKQTLIVKGAFPQITSICDRVELPDGKLAPFDEYKTKIETYFDEQNTQGFRTLGVAYGDGDQEAKLIFLGFLKFSDPIKPDIAEVVGDLKKKGVHLKIITGDHQSVALHIAASIGFTRTSYITGAELHNISEDALIKIVKEKDLFAQIEPNQKEQIILALRKSGYVVGYIGDGINDVSAIHSADVGIAVDSGADAAKEAADFVLLEKDLSVLRAGIEEGRSTFINTLKYVYMATSANFGNMFSMAGASLFLTFLPLLPKQVLLTNFFSDLPEMALATDRVDPEVTHHPVKWDLPFIRRFMLVFGLLNSMADYLTFGVLLFWFHADATLFRSAWFIENVVSAALVVLAIRTKRSLFRSKPGRLLTFAVFVVAIGVLFLPYTALGRLFELSPIPLSFYPALAAIIVIYIIAVEIAKRFFFHNHKTRR
jgi:P-type Mg2+ transporter